MKRVFLLLLFCQVVSPVEHSLKIFHTGSTGVPNFPEFVGVVMVDDTVVVYCDSNMTAAEPKQAWMKKVIAYPAHMDSYTNECHVGQRFFSSAIEILMVLFNQIGGVHIFQMRNGCVWDDETGQVNGFLQYGYDGEDFLAFDLKTQTWIATIPQAVLVQHKWENDKKNITYHLTQRCPELLRHYVAYGKRSLLRKELPSVSLLQKSPSSPISCHATGFYPDRATLIWRKDGEELHEDVDHGEILPNHDGSFQMSVDLKLSLVTPEDWRRYDCVFHLSGVKDDIVTRLDKAVIRTNEEKPTDTTVIIMIGIIAAVVVLALVLIAAIRFVIYKKKNAKPPPYKSETSSSSSDSSTGSQNSTSPLIQEASDSLKRTMNSTP